ncbi:hypothetical protein BFW01_g9640 [Lasiodiplodia theobromae]|nr:hypothetical protein BFW01_g9640 [Lasiodiplodia theobromae]
MQGDGFKPTAEQHCGIQELRSKCNDLQQALRDANQKVERQKAHIANIEQKRGEEKEQLHDAESELEKLEAPGPSYATCAAESLLLGVEPSFPHYHDGNSNGDSGSTPTWGELQPHRDEGQEVLNVVPKVETRRDGTVVVYGSNALILQTVQQALQAAGAGGGGDKPPNKKRPLGHPPGGSHMIIQVIPHPKTKRPRRRRRPRRPRTRAAKPAKEGKKGKKNKKGEKPAEPAADAAKIPLPPSEDDMEVDKGL